MANLQLANISLSQQFDQLKLYFFLFFGFGYENEENSNMFNVMLKQAPEILDLKLGFPTKFEVEQNTVSIAAPSLSNTSIAIRAIG